LLSEAFYIEDHRIVIVAVLRDGEAWLKKERNLDQRAYRGQLLQLAQNARFAEAKRMLQATVKGEKG
jgi:hypothetical protein